MTGSASSVGWAYSRTTSGKWWASTPTLQEVRTSPRRSPRTPLNQPTRFQYMTDRRSRFAPGMRRLEEHREEDAYPVFPCRAYIAALGINLWRSSQRYSSLECQSRLGSQQRLEGIHANARAHLHQRPMALA